ncbi:MAG: hypothetical protein HQL53_00890 [Magnetococcales bacterium]|nr:hypothetical protein [Magnetococcales bacterium]
MKEGEIMIGAMRPMHCALFHPMPEIPFMMNSQTRITLTILSLGAVVALYFSYLHIPVPGPPDFVDYRDATYRSGWGKMVSHTGRVRRIDVAEPHPHIPLVSHHLVLTTEDFNNPDIVKVRRMRDGVYAFLWRRQRPPKGSLAVLHLIPENAKTLRDKIFKIQKGETITIAGQREVDGKIEAAGAEPLHFNQEGHELILVKDVKFSVKTW